MDSTKVAAKHRHASVASLIAAGLLVVLVALPFLLNVAGDAQVHLAIAENFARGFPFRYNPGGELVVASTSPFWTMMLVTFYEFAGSYAPVLLTVAGLLIWLAAAYLLWRAASDLWRLPTLAVWAVVALWLLHTTIVSNALGGLENGLAALQLLLLYLLTARSLDSLTPARSALIGLILGWSLLTRPDGGLFALILLALYAVALWPAARDRPLALLGRLALIAAAAVVVLLPWYAYQFSLTGRLVTDSSVARLYNGRLGSLVLIPDLLYLHPKAAISLGSAFLPLVLGSLVVAAQLTLDFLRAGGRRLAVYRQDYPRYAALVLLLAGFLFFTFVVGAESFGRYFLPLFPFLFLAGVDGWVRFYRYFDAHGRRTLAQVIIVGGVLFLVATSVVDLYRRLGPGSFVPTRAVDVIYGPANRRYHAANLPLLVAAPGQRTRYTDEFLAYLGAAGEEPLAIAVTEVQLRYFLDERVDVISLDGRTSAEILDYVDPASGVPDFERYFLAERPDYVHANQWCAVGGWLASLFTSGIEDNLVCQWETAAAGMQPGDTFQWQGRDITLVAPEIVHINWTETP